MNLLYKKLYEDCSISENFFQCAHFVSIKGEYFEQNSKKFMLIGRAANGWESLNTQNKESFGDEAEEQFYNYKRWNWIENINGILYSCDNKKEKKL